MRSNASIFLTFCLVTFLSFVVSDSPGCTVNEYIPGGYSSYVTIRTERNEQDGTKVSFYSATYKCNSGNSLIGSNTANCRTDIGIWDPLPSCAPTSDTQTSIRTRRMTFRATRQTNTSITPGVPKTTSIRTPTTTKPSTTSRITTSRITTKASTTRSSTNASRVTVTERTTMSTSPVTKIRTTATTNRTTSAKTTKSTPTTATKRSTSTSTTSKTSTTTTVTPPVAKVVTNGTSKALHGPQCRFGYTSPHTLCLPDNSSALVSLEQLDVRSIVDRHNYWRGIVDPPAKQMPKLQWDENLAVEAERWVAQCPRGHDNSTNRRLPYGSVGQNIFWSSNGNASVIDAIDNWAKEVKNWYYGVTNPAGTVGHYTQIIWAKTLYVGCAKSRCRNGWNNNIVCNYSPAGNCCKTPWAYPYVAQNATLAIDAAITGDENQQNLDIATEDGSQNDDINNPPEL